MESYIHNQEKIYLGLENQRGGGGGYLGGGQRRGGIGGGGTVSRKTTWPPHRSTVIFRPSALKSSCSRLRIMSSIGPLALGIRVPISLENVKLLYAIPQKRE